MSFLELKVPPLIVVIIFAILMLLCKFITPFFNFTFWGNIVVSILLFVLGSSIALAGVIHFKKARTTVNPTRPKSTSIIVTSGVYSYSRNPMYLGFFLILLSWAVFLSNGLSFLLVLGFITYINRFQIYPEEIILSKMFGDSFNDYKNTVSRWI